MNKLSADEFVKTEANRDRLYQLINDPVFIEAVEIVLAPLNAVPPATVEAAAISGAFASGAKHLVSALHILTRVPKMPQLKTSEEEESIPTVHEAFLNRLNPNTK